MPAYAVFIRERLRDASVLEQYNAGATSSLAGREVKVLAAYGRFDCVEGAALEGAVILEFPTLAAAREWYESPVYRAAREHRFRGADYRAFFIEGLQG